MIRRSCPRCGMVWLERPVQTVMPDAIKSVGPLHECPPPLPRDVAERMQALGRGRQLSERMRARIRLGLLCSCCDRPLEVAE